MLNSLKDIKFVNSEKILGEGAFSKVYHVRSTINGKDYALKIIDISQLSKSDRQNLKTEIKLHKSLSHPFIINYVDALQIGNKVYILLEFASNGCLFFFIHLEEGIPEKLAIRYLIQTTLAIQHLHSKNLIHRDIKPENILLDDKLNVKLCDFGWSCETDQKVARQSICGTVEYMSPEIVQKGKHSFKTDVWCLGILFYEMLHGQTPFKAESLQELNDELSNKDILVKKTFSNDVKYFLRNLLQQEERKRYDIQQLIESPIFQKYAYLADEKLNLEDVKILKKNYQLNCRSNKRVVPQFIQRFDEIKHQFEDQEQSMNTTFIIQKEDNFFDNLGDQNVSFFDNEYQNNFFDQPKELNFFKNHKKDNIQINKVSGNEIKNIQAQRNQIMQNSQVSVRHQNEQNFKNYQTQSSNTQTFNVYQTQPQNDYFLNQNFYQPKIQNLKASEEYDWNNEYKSLKKIQSEKFITDQNDDDSFEQEKISFFQQSQNRVNDFSSFRSQKHIESPQQTKKLQSQEKKKINLNLNLNEILQNFYQKSSKQNKLDIKKSKSQKYISFQNQYSYTQNQNPLISEQKSQNRLDENLSYVSQDSGRQRKESISFHNHTFQPIKRFSSTYFNTNQDFSRKSQSKNTTSTLETIDPNLLKKFKYMLQEIKQKKRINRIQSHNLLNRINQFNFKDQIFQQMQNNQINKEELKQIMIEQIKTIDNQKREQLEVQLNQYLSNSNEIFLVLFQFLLDEQNQEIIKKASFILLKKISIANLYDVTLEEIFNVGMAYITNRQKNFQVKLLVGEIFQFIMDPINRYQSNNYQIFAQKIIAYVNGQQKENVNRENFLATLICLESIFKTSSFNEILYQFLNYSFELINEIHQKIILENIQFLEDNLVNEQNQNQILLFLREIEFFIAIQQFKIQETFKSFIDSQWIKEACLKYTEMNFIFQIQQIFYIKFSGSVSQNYIYFDIQNEEIQKSFDSIKQNSISILKIIYTYLNKKNSSGFNDQQKIFFKNLIKNIIESLIKYYQDKEINQNLQKRDLIQESIKILQVACSSNDLFEIFQQYKEQIFTEIIIRNLLANEKQYDDFEDNPSEFIQYYKEIIIYEQNQLLENDIRVLLQKMNTYVDSVSTYIVDFLIELIQFSLMEQQQNFNFQILPQIEKTKFFLQTNKQQKLEVAFTILIIIKDFVEQREDLQEKVLNLVNQNFINIIKQREFVQSRLIFFLNAYFDIFKQKQQKIDIVSWIFQQSLSSNKNNFTANENLEIIRKLQIPQKEFLDLFADNLHTVLQFQLRDPFVYFGSLSTLKYFIENYFIYYKGKKERFQQLMNSIVQGIICEDSQQQRNYLYRIKSIFDKIKSIIKNKQLDDFAFDIIEQELQNLMPQIYNNNKELKKWVFEFMETVTLLIFKTKKPFKIINDFFLCIQDIHKADQYDLSSITYFLNQTFYHFGSQFSTEQINIVFQIIDTSLQKTNEDNLLQTEDKFKQYVLVLLLIFMMVENSYEKMEIQHHQYIENLINPNNNSVIFQDEKIRENLIEKTVEIYLLCFIKGNQEQKTYYFQSVQYYINLLNSDFDKFNNEFDQKIVSHGLIALLQFQLQNNNFQNQFFVDIFNFIILYLKYMQNNQIVKLLAMLETQRKLNPLEKKYFQEHSLIVKELPFRDKNQVQLIRNQIEKSSDDSDFEDYDFDDVKQNILQGLIFKIINESEYDHFNKFMELMRSKISDEDIKSILKAQPNQYLKQIEKEIKYLSFENQGVKKRKLRRIIKFVDQLINQNISQNLQKINQFKY